MDEIIDEEENKWETRRQKIKQMLIIHGYTLDLRTLLKEMEYSSKRALINDIKSIVMSLKHQGKQLLIDAPSCIACGFIFKLKEGEIKIPSKCPKCRQQRIEWPLIRIK